MKIEDGLFEQFISPTESRKRARDRDARLMLNPSYKTLLKQYKKGTDVHDLAIFGAAAIVRYGAIPGSRITHAVNDLRGGTEKNYHTLAARMSDTLVKDGYFIEMPE